MADNSLITQAQFREFVDRSDERLDKLELDSPKPQHISLSADGWTEDSGDTAYPFKYTFAVDGVRSDHRAAIILTADSAVVANDSGLCATVEAAENCVIFKSRAKPAETIDGKLFLFFPATEKTVTWADLPDKPVVVKAGDTTMWDCDTEWPESNDVGFHKICDCAPVLSDFSNGGTMLLATDEGDIEFPFSAEEITDLGSGASTYSFIFVFIPAEAVGVDLGGATFTEVGTYFNPSVGDYLYVSITIPGYKGFSQEKIAPSHLYRIDWEQNNESKPDAIKNRPFGDLPYGSDTLSWDGNTDGLESLGSGAFFKLSDVVMRIEQLRACTVRVLENGEITTINLLSTYHDDITEFATGAYSVQQFMIVVSDGGVGANLDGIVFSEPGIYVANPESSGKRFVSLTHEGSTAFPSIKKLDKKYLPTQYFEATLGTTWTEDTTLGVKTQEVAIEGVLASHTAKVDHTYNGDHTAESYQQYVEAETQYQSYVTPGFAETYDGGVKFYIFGDAPTVEIPIIVEVI